jgi:hypothetical protein
VGDLLGREGTLKKALDIRQRRLKVKLIAKSVFYTLLKLELGVKEVRIAGHLALIE